MPETNRYAMLDGIVPTAGLPEVEWHPQAGPQMEAYHTPAFETLYGGEAGAGKSGLLVGLALTAHKRSKLFRREGTQLDNLMEDVERFLGPFLFRPNPPKFNGRWNIWKNVPGNRLIQFGSMKEPDDWKKHKGRGFDFFGFDELTEFEEKQYLSVIGWIRSTDVAQRTRVVGATNPNFDEYGEWVLHRWAAWLDLDIPEDKRAKSGEILWFAEGEDGDVRCDGPDPIELTIRGEKKIILPRSRTFIRGRLKDNKYLGEDYTRTLSGLPEPLRSQLLYGEWTKTREGRLRQIIPEEWVKAAVARWQPDQPGQIDAVGVDPSRGGKDKTAIAIRRGWWVDRPIVYEGRHSLDGPTVARFAKEALAPQESGTFIVDADGIGASVYDELKKTPSMTTIPVIAQEGSSYRDRTNVLKMVNTRSEMWWRFRELLDPKSDVPIALPPDKELKEDLTAPCYASTPRGIRVESKDDLRKRLHRSTDVADAVLLAYFHMNARRVETIALNW